jgi:hypothetical protein
MYKINELGSNANKGVFGTADGMAPFTWTALCPRNFSSLLISGFYPLWVHAQSAEFGEQQSRAIIIVPLRIMAFTFAA